MVQVEDGLGYGEHSSVERVVQIIKDASLSWKGHLKIIDDVKFNYEVRVTPLSALGVWVCGLGV